jgi:hypothetical protein
VLEGIGVQVGVGVFEEVGVRVGVRVSVGIGDRLGVKEGVEVDGSPCTTNWPIFFQSTPTNICTT